jgi:phage shock protein PspC (stress-responsive transcriptional regulator)
MLAGVAAGLARHLAVDVVWVRLAFVLTTVLAGGLGLVAYIAAWIIIPEGDDRQAGAPGWGQQRAGGSGALAGRVPDGVRGARFWVGAGLIALGTIVLLDRLLGPLQARLGWLSPSQLLIPLILILGGMLLWRSSRSEQEPGDVSRPLAIESARSDDTTGHDPKQTAEQHTAADACAVGTRSTAPATRGSALVVGGAVWLLSNLGVEEATLTRALASALLIVGGGLVIGAFVGRGRGLIGTGLLLAPIVVLATFAAATQPGLRAIAVTEDGVVVVDPDSRIEQRPSDLAAVRETYAYGIGSIVLDLSAIDPDQLAAAGTTRVTVELGIGDLLVVLPDGVAVRVDVTLGIGQIDLLGRTTGGLGVEADRAIVGPSPEAGTLIVEIEQGIGRVRVTR